MFIGNQCTRAAAALLAWPFYPALPASPCALDLALDPADRPVVALLDCDSGATRVLGFRPPAWQSVGPQARLPAGAREPRVAMGPKGQPWVCFGDPGAPTRGSASCMSFLTFDWVFAGEAAAAGGSQLGGVRPGSLCCAVQRLGG